AHPDASPYADSDRLQLLVDAVGYMMQPEIAGHLRARAEELLDGLDQDERRRYFSPDRLSSLPCSGGRSGPQGRRNCSAPSPRWRTATASR
ncbi:hypothetical protein CTI14_48040, partial [Methylobacterium radiotolerans]